MEGAVEARKAGKIRFVAISGHGRPDAMLEAVRRHKFDVLMTGFNYLDRFNLPEMTNGLGFFTRHNQVLRILAEIVGAIAGQGV